MEEASAREPSEVGFAGEGLLPVDPDLLTDEPTGAARDFRRHRRAQLILLAVIAIAGAGGALGRYGITVLFPTPAGHIPWATLAINASGSLLAGLILVLITERFPHARLARPLLATGLLGAFTTFSTAMVDTDSLLRTHDFVTATAYALGSVAAAGAAAGLGIALARGCIALDRHLDEHLGR